MIEFSITLTSLADLNQEKMDFSDIWRSFDNDIYDWHLFNFQYLFGYYPEQIVFCKISEIYDENEGLENQFLDLKFINDGDATFFKLKFSNDLDFTK